MWRDSDGFADTGPRIGMHLRQGPGPPLAICAMHMQASAPVVQVTSHQTTPVIERQRRPEAYFCGIYGGIQRQDEI